MKKIHSVRTVAAGATRSCRTCAAGHDEIAGEVPVHDCVLVAFTELALCL